MRKLSVIFRALVQIVVFFMTEIFFRMRLLRSSLFFPIVSFLLLMIFFCPCAGYGADIDTADKKIVRVGYVPYKGYLNGNEHTEKSGSAYDYLQRLRYYTGWEYEYVYGSASEMFRELEAGNIDIVPLVNYTEERSKKFFFSDEALGIEAFSLYIHKDDTSIHVNEILSLNGKRIGVLAGTYQVKLLEEWCAKNHIGCDIVYFDHSPELYDALTSRDIDVVMELRVLEEFKENPPWKRIYRFPSELLYIAVSKKRPDILEELNEAQKEIVSLDEFYVYKSVEHYHDVNKYHDIHLTLKQQEYVKKCGVLKVGYLDNAHPLSYSVADKETGKTALHGLAADYLEAMRDVYGLQFETIVYPDETALLSDLQSGKIDIGLPVTCEKCVVERHNVSLSNPMLSMPISVIHKISEAIKPDFPGTIVILENRPLQYSFVQNNYPKAKVHYVRSTKEALEALEQGFASYFFIKTKYLEVNNLAYQVASRFYFGDMPDTLEPHMAVLSDNPVLISILDKGILLIPEGKKNTSVIQYEYIDVKPSLKNAVRENIVLVSFGVFVFALVLAASFMGYNRKRKADHARLLQAEKTKTEQAQLKANTDFLTKCYNRLIFEEMVNEFLKQGNSGSLLILDLDRFKEVNDTFGHPRGDRLLAEFAKTIRTFFRSDDLVARLGGDEFAVFAAGLNDKKQLASKLSRLNKKLCHDIIDDTLGQVVNVSASIGVACAPEAGTDYETLYQNADRALYLAKKAGRNTFRIYGNEG